MATTIESLPTVSTEYAEISIDAKRSEHQEEVEILHQTVQQQVDQLLAAFCSGDLSPAIATSILVDREDLAPGEWMDHVYADQSDAETAILLRLTERLESAAGKFIADLVGTVEEAKTRSWQVRQQDAPDATETLRRLSV